MIQKIEAHERHLNFSNALKTFYLFSFANYYDPNNIHFGVLRVINDDTLAGEAGFDDHPHQNMEIVTIVLDGELTHKDSMGNKGVIAAGEVQRMSAGKLVVHSEINESSRPVHLYQIWILPHTQNIIPSYEQKNFSTELNSNALTAIVSETPHGGALHISAHATVYRGILEGGKRIVHTPPVGYGVFIYITKGSIKVGNEIVTEADQLRITEVLELDMLALRDAEFILLDVSMND